MEGISAEPKRAKVTPFWGCKRGHNAADVSHTEYITRLTAQRNSLLNQEELCLTQALDRLRLHSLSNRNSFYRLRLRGDATNHVPPSAPERKTMLTTAEQFRQLRPKRQRPVILPLQGKQILGLDQGRPSNNNHVIRVEETNLQMSPHRFIQPVTSIRPPGRNVALKQQESLNPKSKTLLKMKSRVYKQTGQRLTSPFLPITIVKTAHSSQARLHSGQQTPRRLAPNSVCETHKQNSIPQVDVADSDVMKEFLYQDQGDANTLVSCEKRKAIAEGNDGKETDSESRTPCSKIQLYKRQSVLNGSHKDSKQNFDHLVINGSSNSRSHGVYPAHNMNELVFDKFQEQEDNNDLHLPQHSHKIYAANGNNYRKGDESNKNMTDFSYSKTKLPVISHEERDSHASHGSYRSKKKASYNRTDSDTGDGVRNKSIFTVDKFSTCQSQEVTDKQEQGVLKRHIVVDMPTIIFNAPSPIPDTDDSDDLADPESSLTRKVKQQELRRRELGDLLQDVKELTMRAEVLNGQPLKEIVLNETA